MITRDISAAIQEMSGAEVSPTIVSQVTEGVYEQVFIRQNRLLDTLYPIIYLDCIVVTIRHERRVIQKPLYLVLESTTEGEKECLGMWLSETEGAEFRVSVLTELQD
jgi:transposase-like protein